MKYVIGILIALMLTGCNIPYSDGDRAGTVVKFSYKGFFCKTWEGEMTLGGMKTVHGEHGDSVVANTFEFTVQEGRTDIIARVKKALESGKRVKLTYNQLALTTPCVGDSGYLIDAVTEAE